jgi:hypothetical protein
MTSKMPKSLRHWEITREKGMWKFILQTGLGWGAFMFALNLLMATPRRYSILISVGIWLVGGLILAVFVWVVSERRYRRYVDREVTHEA